MAVASSTSIPRPFCIKHRESMDREMHKCEHHDKGDRSRHARVLHAACAIFFVIEGGSAPVAFPGIVLPAGSYLFKLLDSPSPSWEELK